MSRITKAEYTKAVARIKARTEEPINPIQLTLDGYIHEQLNSAQRQLLNPANFVLPAEPVKSELAEAWETTLQAWKQAWNLDTIVRKLNFDDMTKLDAVTHSWREQDNRPAKSVGSARKELNEAHLQIQQGLDNAISLTNDLQQLEMAGARADFENWENQAKLYFWHIVRHVDGVAYQAKRDLELVAEYEEQQATKAMNKLVASN